MDLYITIRDENGDILQKTNIYQDGSDSEGAAQIVKYIADNFTLDESEQEGKL